jgi:hypothetical protein
MLVLFKRTAFLVLPLLADADGFLIEPRSDTVRGCDLTPFPPLHGSFNSCPHAAYQARRRNHPIGLPAPLHSFRADRSASGPQSAAAFAALQFLYHDGYLERPRIQIEYYHRGGSRHIVYGLGNKGAAFLRGMGQYK